MLRLPPLIAATLVLMLSAVIARAEEPDLPSPAAMQKLVDAQQYTVALRQVQRVLSLTGPAAAAYDRFDMLMLRAECQIQIRQQSPALDALALAKKEAFSRQKLDLAADPLALAALLQRSHNFVYTSTAANGPKPINVLDRGQRGAAFLALLADEYPSVSKRVANSAAVKTLAPLMEIAKAAGTLRAAEYAAIRTDKQTDPLTRPIAERAEQLLDSALLDSSNRVTIISHDAQNIVTELAPQFVDSHHKPTLGTVTHRQGLSDNDRQYLLAVQGTCTKVSTAADDMSAALDGQTEIMEAVKTKADTLKQQVAAILNDDYSKIPAPTPQ